MSKVLTINVAQEFVDYVERLAYEESSLKNIITSYIDLHKKDSTDEAINNPVFKSYQKQYMEASTAYEIAKSKISKDFVPECLSGHAVDWNLDFNTNILTITVKCDCGVKILEEYLANEDKVAKDDTSNNQEDNV